MSLRLKEAVMIGLSVAIALSVLNGFNYAVVADQSSNSSQYISIFKYIHRESWMKPGGTFRWPMMGEANTLNPFTFTTSWEYMIIDSVYDTLVEVTPDLKYAGRLAESWSVSSDGKVWTFKLFPNATWHDGKPVKAKDVAFTYNLMRDIGNKTRFSDTAVLIDKAVAIDDYTVKIYLKKPYAPFLYMMASEYYIVPEHIWNKINKTNILKFKNDHPIGSGPFIFVEHKPQQYYKLKANPNYHLGRPLIDAIVMPIISNPDAMLLAFKRGEVDVMTWTVPYNSIPQLKGLQNVHIHAVTEFGARFMYFNCHRWPMNLTKFRLAVHYAVNLTEVANIIYQGYAIPGSLGRIPPTLKNWYDPNLLPKEKAYPFNLTKAAKLLDSIGYVDKDGDGWRDTPNGTHITLSIYAPSYDPLRVRWGQLISNNLKKIGVNVKFEPLEWTTLVNKLVSGDFDMLIIGGIGSLDPDILRMLFHSHGGWNLGHCVVPGLDKLLDEQRYTVNFTKRRQIVLEIQELLAKYVPVLNAVHQQFVFAYRTDNWEGWVLSPTMGPDNWFSLMNLYNIKINKPPSTISSTTTFTTTSATSPSPPTPTPSSTTSLITITQTTTSTTVSSTTTSLTSSSTTVAGRGGLGNTALMASVGIVIAVIVIALVVWALKRK